MQVFGAFDFDNDGDIDLIGDNSDSEIATKFLWAENNGEGMFTVHNNIQFISGDFVQGIAIGTFFNGGPIEIAVSWHDEKIKDVHMITVPSSPKTEQWQTRSISPKSQGEALTNGDIDKDGDFDLLIGTSWLENPGNATTQWTEHVLTTETFLKPVDRNDLVDFDGDGDLDAVIGFESRETPLLVYLAPSDVKSPWEKVTVSTSIGGGTYSLDAEDIDNDNDFDIIIGEQLASKRVLIYENDGSGKNFTLHDMTGSNLLPRQLNKAHSGYALSIFFVWKKNNLTSFLRMPNTRLKRLSSRWLIWAKHNRMQQIFSV